MLSELLTHNKAHYDTAATVHLSNGIAKRWHVMTTLPRLQMLQGEEKTLGSDVRRQLGEIKMDRVVEMESSCAELSSLLAEIEAAKLRSGEAAEGAGRVAAASDRAAAGAQCCQNGDGTDTSWTEVKARCLEEGMHSLQAQVERSSTAPRHRGTSGIQVYYDEQPESAESRQGSLEEVLLQPGSSSIQCI
jgi:hypothetical protein